MLGTHRKPAIYTKNPITRCVVTPNYRSPKGTGPTAHDELLPRLALGAVPRKTAQIKRKPVTLDDHSKVVPLLPIPNRTVKRLCADDSGRTSVKVGHRQALIVKTPER
jgi:hypothetical protein